MYIYHSIAFAKNSSSSVILLHLFPPKDAAFYMFILPHKESL